jgi:hypothetical protein
MPERDKPVGCAAAMSISWKAIAGDAAWVMRCSENGYNFKLNEQQDLDLLRQDGWHR